MKPQPHQEDKLVYDMAKFVKAVRNLVTKNTNGQLDEMSANDLKLWADQLLRELNHYRMSK
jgi:hypothetical protein